MTMKEILIEELIRLMALFGLVIFAALPVAVYVFNFDPQQAFSVLMALPLLTFPALVLFRRRTGQKLRVTTRRSWIVYNGLLGLATATALSLLYGLSGTASWPLAITWFVFSLASLAVLVAWGLHAMPLNGER